MAIKKASHFLPQTIPLDVYNIIGTARKCFLTTHDCFVFKYNSLDLKRFAMLAEPARKPVVGMGLKRMVVSMGLTFLG